MAGKSSYEIMDKSNGRSLGFGIKAEEGSLDPSAPSYSELFGLEKGDHQAIGGMGKRGEAARSTSEWRTRPAYPSDNVIVQQPLSIAHQVNLEYLENQCRCCDLEQDSGNAEDKCDSQDIVDTVMKGISICARNEYDYDDETLYYNFQTPPKKSPAPDRASKSNANANVQRPVLVELPSVEQSAVRARHERNVERMKNFDIKSPFRFQQHNSASRESCGQRELAQIHKGVSLVQTRNSLPSIPEDRPLETMVPLGRTESLPPTDVIQSQRPSPRTYLPPSNYNYADGPNDNQPSKIGMCRRRGCFVCGNSGASELSEVVIHQATEDRVQYDSATSSVAERLMNTITDKSNGLVDRFINRIVKGIDYLSKEAGDEELGTDH